MITYAQYRRSLLCTGAAVAGSLFCANAFAGNVTISGAQTTPVLTSNADGNGPGNVTVTSTGTITLTGGDGITVDSSNSVTNNGTITVPGIDSFGIKTTAPTTGTIINGATGIITTAGANSVGIYDGAGMSGAIVNQGMISTGAPAGTDSLGNPQGAVAGGHAIWVAANVGGVLLDGTSSGLAANSALTTLGGAEAFYIGQGTASAPTNITVGALASDPSGSSLLVRGMVTSSVVTSTVALNALTITGATINGVNYTTTLTGAFQIAGGTVQATGTDTPATAITIGPYASVPSIVNTGTIYAQAKDSSESSAGVPGTGGGNTYALVINAQGNLPQLVNTGAITSESHGATQSAYAVVDNSGTLTNIVNQGSITATVKGTGSTTAFDISHGTAPITFTNSGTIVGDILMGNGGNTFTSTGGSLAGALSMGAGSDTVNLSNTTVTGNITFGNGANTLTASNATLNSGILLGAGTTQLSLTASTLAVPAISNVTVTSAHISGNSTLTFNINAATGQVGGIVASGPVTVDSGTTINTVVTGAVTGELTANLIQAGTLTMNANLATQQPASTVMYSKQLEIAPGNPNLLELSITRNSAASLGLSPNLTKVYNSIVPALNSDNDMSAALGGITSRSDYQTALGALLPDATSATRFATLGAEDLADSAIRRRLDGLLRDREDELGRYRDSWWVQEYTTYGNQDGNGEIPGYRVISQGIASGLDAEVSHGLQVGVSFNETLSFINENQTSDRSVKLSTSGLDFYMRSNNDWGFVQAIAGAAYNGFSGNRTLAVAGVDRDAQGSWSGNQLGAALDVGTVIGGNTVRLTPYLRGAYTRLFEQGYTETGGGDAVDLTYQGHSTTSLRAGGGGIAEYQMTMGDFDMLNLDLRGDYAHEFKTNPTAVNAEFTGDTSLFTIQGLKPSSSVISGGVGAALKYRFSTLSFDYDANYQGGYLAHTVTVTYRHRF